MHATPIYTPYIYTINNLTHAQTIYINSAAKLYYSYIFS